MTNNLIKSYINNPDFIILYGNIIPVKGYKRSTLCDTHRETYYLIPNALFELIAKSRDLCIGKLLDLAKGKENKAIVIEYIDFLLSNELAMITSQPELFPQIPLDWKSPLTITNAIVDFDINSKHNINDIALQLSDLGCLSVELRFFFSPNIEHLEKVVSAFDDTRIKSIELLTHYNPYLEINSITDFFTNYGRVVQITICGAPEEELLYKTYGHKTLQLISQRVESSACCGFISFNNFTVNISMVTESMQYNSCLNRKVGIDSKGNIKNCPSDTNIFGTLQNSSLKEVVLRDDFKKKWKLSKDTIEICQDCEFRYICTDCRVYIHNEKNIHSKPKHCNYDPYTAKWVKDETVTPSI